MARGTVEALEVVGGFQQGVNTEAGPLNFPAGYSADELNFELNKDGSREKRKGIVLQNEEYDDQLLYDGNPYSDPDAIFQQYLWKNAGNTGIDILVVQIGRLLRFYDIGREHPLVSYKSIYLPDVGSETVKASFAVINGDLHIAKGTPAVSIYGFKSWSSSLIYKGTYTIRVRDVWGVEDGLANNDRPTSLSTAHRYNLYNQGWPIPAVWITIDWIGYETGSRDAALAFKSMAGGYPAHSDLYSFFMAQGSTFPQKLFHPPMARQWPAQNFEPPRGRFILQLFSRGKYRMDVHRGHFANKLPLDFDAGGITHLEAYSGRVFLGVKSSPTLEADLKSPNINNMIFFSRVVKASRDAGECYSQNDPTAEDFNEPLDTDGGFVTIPDMGELVGLKALGPSLFVICDNGVWEISGGEGAFSATKLKISKVGTAEGVPGSPILAIEGAVYFLGREAMYVLTIDPLSMSGKLQDISSATIKTLYKEIPYNVKQRMVAYHHVDEGQIRWMHSLGEEVSPALHNMELVFHYNVGAFTVNRFADMYTGDGNYIKAVGYMPKATFNVLVTEEPVYNLTDEVVAGAETVVIPSTTFFTPDTRELQYLTLECHNNTPIPSLSIGECKDTKYGDWSRDWWEEFGGIGIPYRAYLLTGPVTGGDSQKQRQVVYLTTHLELTDQYYLQYDYETQEETAKILTPSACWVQGRWDWTRNVNYSHYAEKKGRFTNKQQVYRPPLLIPSEGITNYGYEVLTNKTKIRGSGKALSLMFESEETKGCHLYGFALNVTINSNV